MLLVIPISVNAIIVILVYTSGESDVDLGFTYDPERSVLLIRRPGVNMSLDWSISLL